jgi:hypothetical protein
MRAKLTGVARRDEGVVKYNCVHQQAEPPEWRLIAELDAWRSRCFDLGLVGVYPDGIGYGNLSQRVADSSSFWVTGTSTGAIPRLGPGQYTRVLRTCAEKNEVSCVGPTKASSESMTHGTIYEELPGVGAVIHVHSRRLWDALIYLEPTTSKDVPYGTPEMCAAVAELLRTPTAARGGVIVTGGHVEGLFVFGPTLDDAGRRLLDLYRGAADSPTPVGSS